MSWVRKDFLMRLVFEFIDGFKSITYNIEKGEIEKAKEKINDSYAKLGVDKLFVWKSDISNIISILNIKNNLDLKKVVVLAELLYYDALIQKETNIKNKLLKKSALLFEYYLKHTKEYSFDIQQKYNAVLNSLK